MLYMVGEGAAASSSAKVTATSIWACLPRPPPPPCLRSHPGTDLEAGDGESASII